MPLSFDSPTSLLIAGVLWCAIIVTAILRRVRLHATAQWLIASGLLLLVPAAGRMHVGWPVTGETVVMIDLSPSTRTAGYRDRAALDRRIRTLLGNTSHRIVYFADALQDHASGNPLADLPADRTVYQPTDSATAIVLFSDGQFELPATAPPTFCVVDPELADAQDAAIEDLQWRNTAPVAIVRNDSGTSRRLTWNGASTDAPPGRTMILPDDDDIAEQRTWPTEVHMRLNAGDAWPENDALSLTSPSPAEMGRWWVSRRPAPSSQWVSILPEQLPTSAVEWLGTAVVVLDNASANDLALPQQQRLMQYVRELGGAVVIVGGDRAFAAGGYAGTPIDRLSPLASHPPQPTRHWLILTDASGSMAQAADGTTRLQHAAAAVNSLLPDLPENDLVTLGSFSDAVRWWVEATSVTDARHQPLPPLNLQPRGPTNLQAAFQQTIASVDPALPTELLLLTDGQASLDDVDALIDALRQRDIRLHLLATGSGDATTLLERIVAGTGGRVVSESNPGRWVEQARTLAQQAMPNRVMRETVQVVATDRPGAFAAGPADAWNRTWLKDDATLLAMASHASREVPMAARWQLGSGTVVAAGYALAPQAAGNLAMAIAQPPRDPRFAVAWMPSTTLQVTVDAIEGDQYLNALDLTLEIAPADASGAATRVALEQIASGAYQAALPAPRQSSIVTVRHGDQVLDRRVIAGRYPAEFEAIGINRETLRALADRTGGRIVEPNDRAALDLPTRHRRIDASGFLAAGAVLVIGAGLLLWRRG